MFMLFNLVAFELCWVALVWGAGSEQAWPGMLAMLLFVVINLAASRQRRADLAVAGLALGLGVIADTALLQSGLVAYASPGPLLGLAPAWILLLWLGFSQTLNHCLAWLGQRPVLAVLFGALGGPASYWAAQRVFDAAQFPLGWWQAMLALGIAWAVVTPVLSTMALRWRHRWPADHDGTTPTQPESA
jgi:hypothetical protein